MYTSIMRASRAAYYRMAAPTSKQTRERTFEICDGQHEKQLARDHHEQWRKIDVGDGRDHALHGAEERTRERVQHRRYGAVGIYPRQHCLRDQDYDNYVERETQEHYDGQKRH